MRTSSVLAFAAVVAPAVLAGPFFTSPVAGTTCTAGQPCTISWNDDNIAPLLAQYGDCTIGVYAGSQQQQSLMQAVTPANAASTGSVIFTPDAGMGENSNAYFIKMISTTAADPTNAMYKATAYSAMFTLTGMTGTFSDTVKAQIAGTAASSGAAGSVAPVTVPATTAAATTSASASGSSSASRAASSSASRSASAASSSSSAAANGASAVHVAGLGAFGAAVAAIFAAFL
ncbi:hypothetical protein BDV93DRAFT_520198 [Ceratobasidium sp. AG-I]|nr:hypothetical protein BDV93DRAFT_520198 [Ceratobasidium sp. AG-I]